MREIYEKLKLLVFYRAFNKIRLYRLQAAEKELQTIEAVLAEKQQELAKVLKKIEELQEQYDVAVTNLNKLEAEMEVVEARLSRSERLTSALFDERIRWEEMTHV